MPRGPRDAEMPRNWGSVAKSVITEVLPKPFGQAMANFVEVQCRVKRAGTVINNISRDASERVSDTEAVVVGSGEKSIDGDKGAGVTTEAEAGEITGYGGRIRSVTLGEEVTEMAGSFKGREGCVIENG